jgi:hypothetical protein
VQQMLPNPAASTIVDANNLKTITEADTLSHVSIIIGN